MSYTVKRLKDLELNSIVSDRLVNSLSLTYKNIFNVMNFEGTLFYFSDNLTDFLKGYYGDDKLVVEETFENNFTRIWNRNILSFIDGLMRFNYFSYLMLDDNINSEMVRTLSHDGTENTDKLKEISKLLNEVRNISEELDKSETRNIGDTTIVSELNTISEVDETDETRNIEQETNNESNKTEADNPNSTTANILNDYITRAEKIIGTNDLDSLDTFNKLRELTKEIDISKNVSNTVDDSLSGLDELTRDDTFEGDENVDETENIIKSNQYEVIETIKSNLSNEYIKLLNEFSGVQQVYTNFVSKFEGIFLPSFFNGERYEE